MKKMMMLFAIGAMFAGCSATKVEYNQNDKGETSYRIYRNSHWLKTDAEGVRGGMSRNGSFTIEVDGMKSSPSEEFNRTMQTYMGAIVSAMQIAAAAYNPSASAALANMQGGAAKAERQSGLSDLRSDIKAEAAIQDGGATNGVECADGSCTNAAK